MHGISFMLCRTTPSSVATTRAWLRTSTNVSTTRIQPEAMLISFVAMIQPSAMPGNNTFVAGFTQCTPSSFPSSSHSSDRTPQPTSATPALTREHPPSLCSCARLTFPSYSSLGAYCESPGEEWDGQPCEFEHSTCGNKTEDCHGRCVFPPPPPLPSLSPPILPRACGSLTKSAQRPRLPHLGL